MSSQYGIIEKLAGIGTSVKERMTALCVPRTFGILEKKQILVLHEKFKTDSSV
jgi:hypothetical protein